MLAFTEFHQLLKVPFMIEHFKTHRLADPSLSFISFLKIHYVGPIIIDDDYQQDQQLPFRDVDCSLMNTTVCECDPISVEIKSLPEVVNEFHCYNEINKPQFAAFGIFQPPRCA